MTITVRERIQATVAALEKLAATDALEELLIEAEWVRSTTFGQTYYAVKNFEFPPFPDVDYLNGDAQLAFAQGVKFAQECFMRKIEKMRKEEKAGP
jgi:hypothetical protein